MGSIGTRSKQVANKNDEKVVIQFAPDIPCSPSSPHFVEYCKCSLMKHKPWEDKPENVWGGPDATKDEIIAIWKSFCDSLAVVPDSLRLSIARYKAFVMHNSGELPDGDDWDGDDFDNDTFQDEWQQMADSNQFIGDDDYMLDSTVHVPWNPNYRHDVSPVQDYSAENGNEPTMVEVNDSYEPERRLTEPLDAHIVMNTRQKLAVDMVLDLTNQDANDDDARKQGILIGIGGTGKSTCIHDIQHKVEAQHGLGSVVKLAPTGKAASVIGGHTTLHSKQRGLLFGSRAPKVQQDQWPQA